MKLPFTIAHISDLHLGGSYFVPEWGNRLVDLLNRLKPGLIVITGDLTTEGHIHEYEQVVTYLKRFHSKNRIIVPGNHDARNEGYVIFEEIFGTRYPFYKKSNIAIFGVDSSQPDIDDGHIGRANYPIITQKFSNPTQIKIMAMHHHLVPIPGTGRERHIPTDAGDVLKLCIDLDIRIILSGHKHRPWVWLLEKTWLITGGTATSQRLKGRSYPSFNILKIFKTKFTLTEINVATGIIQKKLKASL